MSRIYISSCKLSQGRKNSSNIHPSRLRDTIFPGKCSALETVRHGTMCVYIGTHNAKYNARFSEAGLCFTLQHCCAALVINQ